ncbi:hypothetical protein GJAV_G00184340 [Gymnothorax javanicus]|nr:hypothetical protein GJAV_G00184340 [Gymnothorax javanicus]
MTDKMEQAFFQIDPPSEFDFTRPEEWPLRISGFEHFRQASGLDKQSLDKQVNTLLCAMGLEVESVVCCRDTTAEQLKNYETAMRMVWQGLSQQTIVPCKRCYVQELSEERSLRFTALQRWVSLPFKNKVKEELRRMEDLGIISRVEQPA